MKKDPESFSYLELGPAQGVHSDPGTHRVHYAGLLADGVAGEGVLHRDGHQDLRLHPSDVCPVLAGGQEQGGGLWRGRRHRGERGAARQLHDKVDILEINKFNASIKRFVFLSLKCSI